MLQAEHNSKLVNRPTLARAEAFLAPITAVQSILLKRYTRIVYAELKEFPSSLELERDLANAFKSFAKLMSNCMCGITTVLDIGTRMDNVQQEVQTKLMNNDLTRALMAQQRDEFRQKSEAEILRKARVFTRVAYEAAMTLSYVSETWMTNVAHNLSAMLLRAYDMDREQRELGRSFAAARIQSLYRMTVIRMKVSAIWKEADAIIAAEKLSYKESWEEALNSKLEAAATEAQARRDGHRGRQRVKSRPNSAKSFASAGYETVISSSESSHVISEHNAEFDCATNLSMLCLTESVLSFSFRICTSEWASKNMTQILVSALLLALPSRTAERKSPPLLCTELLPQSSDPAKCVTPSASSTKQNGILLVILQGSPLDMRVRQPTGRDVVVEFIWSPSDSEVGSTGDDDIDAPLVASSRGSTSRTPSLDSVSSRQSAQSIEASTSPSKGSTTNRAKKSSTSESPAPSSSVLTVTLSELSPFCTYDTHIVVHAALLSDKFINRCQESLQSSDVLPASIAEVLGASRACYVGGLQSTTLTAPPEAPSLSVNHIHTSFRAGANSSDVLIGTTAKRAVHLAERVSIFELKWCCPISNGSKVTKFQLHRRVLGGVGGEAEESSRWERIMTSNVLTYTDVLPDKRDNQSVQYRLRAMNSCGWSSFSPAATFPLRSSSNAAANTNQRQLEILQDLRLKLTSSISDFRDMAVNPYHQQSQEVPALRAGPVLPIEPATDISNSACDVKVFAEDASTAASDKTQRDIQTDHIDAMEEILTFDDWLDQLSEVCPIEMTDARTKAKQSLDHFMESTAASTRDYMKPRDTEQHSSKWTMCLSHSAHASSVKKKNVPARNRTQLPSI